MSGLRVLAVLMLLPLLSAETSMASARKWSRPPEPRKIEEPFAAVEGNLRLDGGLLALGLELETAADFAELARRSGRGEVLNYEEERRLLEFGADASR